MSTDAKAKKAKKKTSGAKSEAPALPDGTEVILWRQQFAAALSMGTRQFDTLVAEGKIPAPDGPWQGKRFWYQSTVNAFVRSLAKAK